MTRLYELESLGQSVWYDYIRRSFITSGELNVLIDQGLRGVTSNPSIFEKAIAGSADYDEDLKRLVADNKSVDEIYETLVIEDISLAADLLKPVYESTRYRDGFISLEVSPSLAHDTGKTITEAKRLFETLNRPNVMIKVPATQAGIPAITKLIASGVNVNVTLIFGVDNYKEVAEAYLTGLEELASEGPSVKGGHSVDQIASVASFFVSRVDTAVDQALEKKDNTELVGKIAVANAKAAYEEFQDIFTGPRWEKLAEIGAKVQRLLWASTGTKNSRFKDTLYVDELIGPDTVNTVPPATLKSFIDHGTVAETLTKDLGEAKSQLSQLTDLGIDLTIVTRKLQDEGVAAFDNAFKLLMQSIVEKRDRLLAGKENYSLSLGKFQAVVDGRLKQIRENEIPKRIWEHDHKVWKEDPTEISNRLGWLHSPEIMSDAVDEIYALVDEVRAAGYSHALLLGMGGSSLAPEVFRLTFGVKEGYLNLAVLDSTDPGAVFEKRKTFDPSKTLFIISTKSGGTVETFSFMKYFYNKTLEAVGADKAGEHFIAITDPGSGLESMGKELRFRKIFLNDPNIGGRYSALSYFGLVPAALIGMDINLILERAETMAQSTVSCNCPVHGDNTAAHLGVTMGELALAGRDKVTLITSLPVSYFGAWVEQLIAESTGKEGKGILPVSGETVSHPDRYGNDRLFVYLRIHDDSTCDADVQALIDDGQPVIKINLRDLYDLCGEFFRWEMATVIAGMILGINPFDQPNVESAKILARNMVSAYQKEGRLPELEPRFESDGIKVYSDFSANSISETFQKFFSFAELGENEGAGRSYVSIQAFIKPGSETDEELQSLRTKIQQKYRMAVTVGYGPRFLHSTGQLHKGDAGHGLFIQIVSGMEKDLAIPDEAGGKKSSITFGVLKNAQAMGDRQALLDGNRRVILLDIGKDISGAFQRLKGAL